MEGLDCLVLYSIRNIKANESITVNYSAQIQVLAFILEEEPLKNLA